MDHVDLLYRLFSEIPPCQDRIDGLFSEYDYSPMEMAEVAVMLTKDCGDEYLSALAPEVDDVTVDSMHSNHLVENLSILLEHGLDPNMEFDGESPLWNTIWIDAPNVGAAALRLLLKHGGDPNYRLKEDPAESVFEYIAYQVAYEQFLLHKMQIFLVLMAYGATYRDGRIPIKMLNGNEISIFKDFDKYGFDIQKAPSDSKEYIDWMVYIYDKETKETVAIY